MPLPFKERKKILKNTNTLDLTPIKLYSEETDSNDLVTVIIPKFKNKIAVKFVSPKLKSDIFRVKLDNFGSAVWLKIDGKTTVDKIINDIKKKFGDEIIEAEDRITKFMFQLYSQGFISFKEIN